MIRATAGTKGEVLRADSHSRPRAPISNASDADLREIDAVEDDLTVDAARVHSR